MLVLFFFLFCDSQFMIQERMSSNEKNLSESSATNNEGNAGSTFNILESSTAIVSASPLVQQQGQNQILFGCLSTPNYQTFMVIYLAFYFSSDAYKLLFFVNIIAR